jgi:hypothetical protein
LAKEDPELIRRFIIRCCEVALVPLGYWQYMGAPPQPATVIATGVVLGVWRAATIRWDGDDG